MNTVIVTLAGGMGNQLFQYAFGRHLAVANGARLVIDATGYGHGRLPDSERGLRVCELSHFNIVGEIITGPENDNGLAASMLRKMSKISAAGNMVFDRHKPYFLRREIQEPLAAGLRFDENVYRRVIKGSVTVRGFWQSEKYFADIEVLLRRELTLRDEPDEINAQLARQIRAAESVGVHFRHGDNANEVAMSLGVLPSAYYAAAVRLIGESILRPHFYVFSDDMPWARTNWHFGAPATFVEHNGVANSHEDLRLMSYCKHHILANSTFGWWGAWLGKKVGQIVYAPRRYYQNLDRPNPDLYPADWRLL